MHEATIANSILDIVSRRCNELGGREVISLNVRIGAFRNVDLESLEFAFDAMKLHYPGFESCALLVEQIEVQALCSLNGHRYSPTFAQSFRCSLCEAGIGVLVAGEELDVTGFRLAEREEVTDARAC